MALIKACCIFAILGVGFAENVDLSLNEKLQSLENTVDAMKKFESKLVSRVEEMEARENALLKRIADLETGTGSGHLSRSRRQFSHVAFTAYLDRDIHNMTNDEIIVYDKILLNHGSGYDNSTGIFSAPTGGVYLFSWSSTAKDIPYFYERNTDLFTKLTVNGVHMLGAVAESVKLHDDEQGGNTAVLYIQEGDKVWTAHIGRGGTSLYGDPGERTNSFTGVLLYQILEDSSSQLIG